MTDVNQINWPIKNQTKNTVFGDLLGFESKKYAFEPTLRVGVAPTVPERKKSAQLLAQIVQFLLGEAESAHKLQKNTIFTAHFAVVPVKILLLKAVVQGQALPEGVVYEKREI